LNFSLDRISVYFTQYCLFKDWFTWFLFIQDSVYTVLFIQELFSHRFLFIQDSDYTVLFIQELFSHDFCLFRIQSTQYCLFKNCFHMISVYSGFSLHSTVYSRIVFTWFLFIQDSVYTVLFTQELFSHDFCLFRIQTTQYCLFKNCFHMISVYSGFRLHSTVYSRIVFTWFLFTQSLAYIDLLLKRLWEWLCHLQWKVIFGGFRVIMINTTFHNISVISWWSVLLVEETKVPRENHRPVASHWQTLSHNVVSSTPRHEQSSNSQL
jgi:hypothetical protein